MDSTEHKCSKCGDSESVPKWVAWDAYWQIPNEVEGKLLLLKELSEQINKIMLNLDYVPNDSSVTVMSKASHMHELIVLNEKVKKSNG